MTEVTDALVMAAARLAILGAPALLVASAVLIATSLGAHLAKRTMGNMQRLGYFEDAKDYVETARLYGWFGTLRGCAGWLLMTVAAACLMTTPNILPMAILAIGGVTLTASRFGPQRRYSGAPLVLDQPATATP